MKKQPESNPLIKFRPDIEGLRGIAVLSVILFHLSFKNFSGGFIGVDIFFVISGFLISNIIEKRINSKTFSLRKFYYERFVRIVPAFVCMLVPVTLVSYTVLLQRDFNVFINSLISSLTFTSNIAYAYQAGYFSTASEINPLLHTWSLSVEEQFYLLIPIACLMVSSRDSSKFIYTPLIIISFLLSIWFSAYEKTFFFSPFRFWEFSLGALVSINRISICNGSRQIISAIGFALIIISMSFFDQHATWPFLFPAVPALGTAAVLIGKESDPISRLLSNGLLRYFGKISFSLYLWHWPIIVLYKYYNIKPLSGLNALTIVIVTLAISHCSWAFIEKPWRQKDKPRRKFGLSLAFCTPVLCSLLFIAFAIPTNRLVDYREVDAIYNLSENKGGFHRCLELPIGECSIGSKSKPPSFVLWGDSHASSIADKVDADASLSDKSGILVVTNSCPPLFGVRSWWKPSNHRCIISNDLVSKIANNPEIDTIIIQGLWEQAINSSDLKLPEFVDYIMNLFQSKHNKLAVFESRLMYTIEKLKRKGLNIKIVGNVPEAVTNIPRALAMARMLGNSIELGLPYKSFIKEYDTEKILKNVAIRTGVEFISPSDYLCRSGVCTIYNKGNVIYFDHGHLNKFGSLMIDGDFFEKKGEK